MKILITNCHLSVPHGSEVWTLVVARELKRRGHEVYIWSPELGPFWAKYMAEDFEIISGEESCRGSRFDLAIIQHAKLLVRNDFFRQNLQPALLPNPEAIILMSHSHYTKAEEPIVGSFATRSHFVCISKEIAQHFDPIAWNVVKQPVDPTWFKIPLRRPNMETTILWASHRHPVPKPLRIVCQEHGIKLMALGAQTIFPENVREVYSEADLIIGTGRWIYEGMAAGRPCIVADSQKQLGYVTPVNVESYEDHNMTTRHRNAIVAEWSYLIRQYSKYAAGQLMREYAKQNYHVSVIVDQLLEIVKP